MSSAPTPPKIPLITLKEPDTAQPGQPSLKAFLELGFRPLYLGGTAWALLAVALWVFVPQWLRGPLAGLAWHAHEMLWGFVITIAVGFLMTAGANWTGINPLSGRALGVATALWAAARLGFMLPFEGAFWVAFACEIGFLGLAAGAMGRAVVLSANRRNYALPGLLAALALIDALYLLTAREGDYAQLMQRFHAGLSVMALVALLIARRVIPFFAMRAIPGLTIPQQMHTGWVQIGACALAAAALLGGLERVAALGWAVAGALAWVQVLSWKPWAVRGNALLWILYIGFAGLGTGLILAALPALGLDLPRVLSVHVIAMAGFSVLIIGMVTRTALGHLGRALAADRRIRLAYWLLLAAVFVRVAAIVAPGGRLVLLHSAAALWIAAFGVYLWQFAPMLIRPRL